MKTSESSRVTAVQAVTQMKNTGTKIRNWKTVHQVERSESPQNTQKHLMLASNQQERRGIILMGKECLVAINVRSKQQGRVEGRVLQVGVNPKLQALCCRPLLPLLGTQGQSPH